MLVANRAIANERKDGDAHDHRYCLNIVNALIVGNECVSKLATTRMHAPGYVSGCDEQLSNERFAEQGPRLYKIGSADLSV